MDNSYYYELVIKPSSNYQLFLDFLIDIYPDGFEEFDGSFILRNSEPLDEVLWAIEYFKSELEKHLQIEIELDVLSSKKENRDWIENFKKSIQPIFINPFYIHPSWHQPKEGAKNIILDPALAFGSGHHETTSSVIEILKNILSPEERVLDVGTGSGILSLVSAKIGAKVDLCDIDEISIESAKENFQKNGLEIGESWVGSANGTEKSYSIVLANIIPEVIIEIAPDLQKRVEIGGKLILSGILEGREFAVLNSFITFKVIQQIKKGEWVTLLLEKYC